MAGEPWWWLREDEARALGLGAGAVRTERGVLFGDPSAPVRLEVIARDDAAPLKLGPISVRVWGAETSDRAVVALLHRVARTLHARRGTEFRPEEIARVVEDVDEAPRPAVTLIDVPSVCARACAFCGISKVPHAMRRPRGDDAAVERAIAAATGAVLFTGDDALSHPSIERWIAMARTPSLVGPPRAGRERAIAARLTSAGLVRWSSGIFGASAEAHDAIAGEIGAFDALRDACAALREAGIEVELITPMVRPTIDGLAEIVALGAAWSARPVVAQLYVPDPSVGDSFDAMVPPWRALRTAIARVDRAHATIEGAPPCVLSGAHRGTRVVLDRSEASTTSYPSATCSECPLRAACPGIAESTLRAVGHDGLGSSS
ncbi:radical SAM protein [Sandaracinus amylolyticus]|uniref:radical SAM protein n=1 Tax=Sandaracinus amylolyticus TaxID=927083 RepID=UPI001F216D17|nr:radical SAM protein [Sandaracinus amylolyticus]UJR84362.1 Hypothetical protein I5071_64410 [Sandaracinus amylolyticus]